MSEKLDPRIRERNPFGEESCEHEKRVFRDKYSDYFFDYAPFIDDAMRRRTYLIVGRRGAGKTSLAQYFTFQAKIANLNGIDVDEPNIYQQAFQEIEKFSGISDDLAIERLLKVWEFIVWNQLFHHYQDDNFDIKKAAARFGEHRSPVQYVQQLVRGAIDKYVSNGGGVVVDNISELMDQATFKTAVSAVLKVAQKKPTLIAIDSQERYDHDDEALMQATAALVQFGSNFNQDYSYEGLHLKIFMSGEVFPHLSERWITNTTKFVRDEVYLHWRPKDLVRLVMWRLSKYLEERGELPNSFLGEVEWDSFSDVHNKLWVPYFGESLKNGRGLTEKTFPYILRHTQLRPRQLVRLCNKIAEASQKNGSFPQFLDDDIVTQINTAEVALATEVMNSYEKAYPRAAKILDALNGAPAIFKGAYLDKLAPRTAKHWPAGNYSPHAFRQLVAELGVVGRLRRDSGRIIQADFEYAMDGRLVLAHDSICVVHPMFYRKLNINRERDTVIYPFPDHPDYEMFE